MTHADSPSDLELHDPWVREVPPVSESSAAYVRIENTGSADRALVSADNDRFERIELHESRVDDEGTMTMVHLDEIPLAAGETTALEPGGYHIMLIDRIGEALSEEEGDTLTISLMFDDGERVDVEAPVMRHGPDGEDMDHHEMDDHHMEH